MQISGYDTRLLFEMLESIVRRADKRYKFCLRADDHAYTPWLWPPGGVNNRFRKITSHSRLKEGARAWSCKTLYFCNSCMNETWGAPGKVNFVILFKRQRKTFTWSTDSLTEISWKACASISSALWRPSEVETTLSPGVYERSDLFPIRITTGGIFLVFLACDTRKLNQKTI